MVAAATLATTLDRVADWVRTEVAEQLEYLVPPDDGAVEGIEVIWAHPSVFQMFVPAVERLQSGELQTPSIAVQFMGGNDSIDDANKNDREIRIRLLLTIWAPGHYEDDGRFVRDWEGWRDLFNGLGVISNAVNTAETIAGCTLDRSVGIDYGLFDIKNEIPDLYPYWMGKVDFRLRRAPHANERFTDLL